MLGTLAEFQRLLLRWFSQHRRDLPWRVPKGAPAGARPDPYHVLVSEAMLQQTQVATAIPYFRRFVRELPNLAALATASEQDVLRLWQGLGYYSRARHLRGTAQIVLNEYGMRLPERVEELMRLPGIGRYTAGAIASLAFGQRAPILDGNVRRVLCRVDLVREDPARGAVQKRLWKRAEEILPAKRVGDFNSAMMELGATVCTARSPRCEACPAARLCEARAAGLADQIPPAAAAKARAVERRCTVCIQRGTRWLVEQRPGTGRWAGLWQFVTFEAGRGAPRAGDIAKRTGVAVREIERMGEVRHDLSHRRYQFEAYRARARRGAGRGSKGRRWVELGELSTYPMSRPQQRIAAMLVGARI